MDEYNYDRLAAANAAGRSFFPGEIHSLPGYPALLTLLYRTGGRSPGLVRGVQVLLGALSCGLTFLVGRKILGTGGGLLAGLILAFYGPAVFFEGRILPATAALFFSLAALVWWTDPPEADRALSRTFGGILLGLAALFSPAILLFALFLLLFSRPRRRGEEQGLLRRIGPAALGILAVLIPFGVRNSLRAGGPVLLTAHSGINFFIGNNPEAGGGFRTPLFLTPTATGIIVDSRREAERRTGEELNPAQVSRFWFNQGLRHLVGEHAHGARTWGKKLLLLFSPREYLDIGGEAAGLPARLFGVSLLSFGLLLPPALVGFFLLPRKKPARGPLLAFFAAQVLATLLYFHQGRNRLLLVPVLAISAAAAVRFLWRSLREGRLMRTTLPVSIMVILAIIIRTGGRKETRSETNLLLFRAQQEIIRGNPTAARALAEQALTLHPELGGAGLVLGAAAEAAGETGAAENYYRETAGKEPYNPKPDLRLSLLHLEKGRIRQAEEAARQALVKDPLSWRAHSLLADVFRERGDEEEAYRHLLRAVELNPNSARDQLNLALYYGEKGDRALADYHRQRAERVAE